MENGGKVLGFSKMKESDYLYVRIEKIKSRIELAKMFVTIIGFIIVFLGIITTLMTNLYLFYSNLKIPEIPQNTTALEKFTATLESSDSLFVGSVDIINNLRTCIVWLGIVSLILWLWSYMEMSFILRKYQKRKKSFFKKIFARKRIS